MCSAAALDRQDLKQRRRIGGVRRKGWHCDFAERATTVIGAVQFGPK
jgi:hypothetical protein